MLDGVLKRIVPNEMFLGRQTADTREEVKIHLIIYNLTLRKYRVLKVKVSIPIQSSILTWNKMLHCY